MAGTRTILITGSTDGHGREVARRLAAEGAAPASERLDPARVTVNAVHPATLMDTKMVRQTFGRAMTSVERGVEVTLYLVDSPELQGVSGRFFDGKREARAHPQAYDPETRRRPWELSERLCGLSLEPRQESA
jgi:NAD(P)-dependent dehydrogenase (short-subunit alcohol dehydrogenase family)